MQNIMNKWILNNEKIPQLQTWKAYFSLFVSFSKSFAVEPRCVTRFWEFNIALSLSFDVRRSSCLLFSIQSSKEFNFPLEVTTFSVSHRLRQWRIIFFDLIKKNYNLTDLKFDNLGVYQCDFDLCLWTAKFGLSKACVIRKSFIIKIEKNFQ
jgi:hypothetical protein